MLFFHLVKDHLDGQPHWYKLHGLQDIVIPGYRQPGTRAVAPPISQADQVKTIKVVCRQYLKLKTTPPPFVNTYFF